MGAPKSTTSGPLFGVDDLFQQMHEAQADPGPFVINLTSSSVPISLPNKGIPLTRNTRIYHIRRTEDARVRYRLRLGPFMTEAQANAVLGIVREGYPEAFTTAAIQEDLESVADIQFEAITAPPEPKPAPPSASMPLAVPSQLKPAALATPSAPPAATKVLAPAAARTPAVSPSTLPAAAKKGAPAEIQPAAKVEPPSDIRIPAVPAKTVVPPPAAPPPPRPPMVQAVVTQKASAAASPSTPLAAPVRPLSAASSPAPASGVLDAHTKKSSPATLPTVAENLKTLELTLAPDLPPPPASASSSTTLAHQVSTLLTSMILELEPDDKPRTDKGKVTDLPHRQAPAALRQSIDDREPADLESTQTLRALTTAELEGHNKLSQWYSIELSVADRPFDPDAVPDLDIFSAYRLYVIESKGAGRAIYALRLGFFGEEVAAKAVAGYLTDHYQNANVMRVSIAERERFSERRVQARKKVEATGKHAAIEITDQRYIRELSLIER